MGDEPKKTEPVAAITKADLESLGASILTKVDEKLAALKPAEGKAPEEGEKTPDQLRKEGSVNASRIMAAAAMSGLADHEKLATEAIERGMSVEDFKLSIYDRALVTNGLTKDDGDSGEGDPHAKFRAEYKAEAAYFAAEGVKEDSYIRTRCRDENLPIPLLKKAS